MLFTPVMGSNFYFLLNVLPIILLSYAKIYPKQAYDLKKSNPLLLWFSKYIRKKLQQHIMHAGHFTVVASFNMLTPILQVSKEMNFATLQK